jgi:hypothetical protein
VRGTQRLVRASVMGVVAASVVVLTPGVAAADSATTQRDCDRIWMWWLPLPCLRD